VQDRNSGGKDYGIL